MERVGPYYTYALFPDSTRAIAPDLAYSSDTLARITVLKRSTGQVLDSLKVPGTTAADARWCSERLKSL